MPQAHPLNIYMVVPLSDELRNQNTVKVLREQREMLEEFIDHMIDNPPSPAIKMSPKERYQWLLAKITDTYQGDVWGMEVEINILLDETLPDRIAEAMRAQAQGIPVEMPMLPASAPFVNYIPGMLLGLRAWQKRFVAGWKQYGGGNGPALLVPPSYGESVRTAA